jgi:CheY-like chemotaxis protein
LLARKRLKGWIEFCLHGIRYWPIEISVAILEQLPVILLAEDDELTAAAWSAVLRLSGFEVIWAPDGSSAWALARAGRPDLLLTDWNMPGMDGPELCQVFRADPLLAGVPIILASSLKPPPSTTPALHDLFLEKPANAAVLLAAISGLVVAKDNVNATQRDPDSANGNLQG